MLKSMSHFGISFSCILFDRDLVYHIYNICTIKNPSEEGEDNNKLIRQRNMYIFVWAGDVDTIFRINRVYDIASFQNATNSQACTVIKSNCWILHRAADSEYFSGENIPKYISITVLSHHRGLLVILS